MTEVEDFVAQVRRQQGGILLDTNVLLLYLIDRTDPTAFGEWKKTQQFTERHVLYLRTAVEWARHLVTTPHVVTEVTNLSTGIHPKLQVRYWEELRAFVSNAREHWVRASSCAADKEFRELGLADMAQALLPRRARPLIITVDASLYACITGRRLPAMNLNHYAFRL